MGKTRIVGFKTLFCLEIHADITERANTLAERERDCKGGQVTANHVTPGRGPDWRPARAHRHFSQHLLPDKKTGNSFKQGCISQVDDEPVSCGARRRKPLSSDDTGKPSRVRSRWRQFCTSHQRSCPRSNVRTFSLRRRVPIEMDPPRRTCHINATVLLINHGRLLRNLPFQTVTHLINMKRLPYSA